MNKRWLSLERWLPSRKQRGLAGCAICCSDDADQAWKASRRDAMSLRSESHFSVKVCACEACGQNFVRMFCETVDWLGGEDPQYGRLLPIQDDEAVVLIAAGDGANLAQIITLGQHRRHLSMAWPKGSSRSVRWVQGGFMIDPHD